MMSDPWGLRPATDADLVAYREANQGALADAGDFVADNWEYVAAGAMVVAGGVLMATGVGGPVGAMLVSGGISMGVQKASTGSVDPLQLALDMVPGGVVVQGLAGAGSAAYSYVRSPGPHNVAGFLGDVVVAGVGGVLPGPSAGGKRVVGGVADAAVDTGGAQAVRAVTPSSHLRAGLVGPGGDVSSGVGKLGDVSPRPVQQFPHPIGPVEEKVYSTLARVDEKGTPLPGYKGGRTWGNNPPQLPSGTDIAPINYREWYVDPNVKGIPRNSDRLVTGSDGSAYYTTDHYKNFILFRESKG